MTGTPSDFAVVGTDTGVGKTVVTAGLTRWLRDQGVDARAIKPCQTGYPPDDDAQFVADACAADAASTCLRRLEPPLAPAVAAARTDESLSYAELVKGCETAIAESEVGIVEGIGGVRVPLADGREVVDLVADLDLPVILVSRSGLGTLNHTALTVEALRDRDVRVRGVVLNEYEGATVAERTNPRAIEDMTSCTVETVPPIEQSSPASLAAAVRDHLSQTLAVGSE
ncbi:dethiobiotin synthase [Halorientalis brevis]|uniref:ATP-dependent dethiobiotin synthetase BioD n=1 Tax=Halorientalis brevis TaxID=1126241 RepID=A0ABD6CGD8_9EURY|nr:dethiobiotin synthase [Halorientalis brevis]